MIRFILFSFILFLNCFNFAYAAIPITYSINSTTTQDLAKIIDPTTLVLVNINNTVVTLKSKMFRYFNNPYRTFINNLVANAKITPSLNKSLTSFLQNRKIMLVESDWPSFIEKLKATGAMVIGLYYTPINENSIIKNPEEWHYQELKYFNVNFTDKINNQELITINPKSNEILFYKGILFTNQLSKSNALIKLMEITNTVPSKIVIFDSRLDDLKQMQYALRIFNIDFYPIQYLAEQKIEGTPNIAIIKLQQDTMLINKQWLEDEEAERLLTEQQSVQK